MQENNFTRMSNYELLRIVAMFMIIGCHFSGHGVMHMLSEREAYVLWNSGTIINKIATCVLMPGAQIGTAIFFLISGYFGINIKVKSVIRILLMTVFYGLISCLLFGGVLVFGGVFPELSVFSGISYIFKMLIIPLSGGAWWFVATYVALLMVSPLINKFLRLLSKKGIFIVLMAIWVFWYSFGSIGTDFYNLKKAIYFYMLGYAMFKFREKKVTRIMNIFVIIATWCFGGAIYYYTSSCYAVGVISITQKISVMLFEMIHVAFVTPICAIALLKLFESFSFQNRSINKLAGTTFGVFLFHDSGIVREFIWNSVLKVNLHYKSRFFVIYMYFCLVSVFGFGALLDYVRGRLTQNVENKITEKTRLFIGQLK